MRRGTCREARQGFECACWSSLKELEANRVLREDFVELLRQPDLRVRWPVVRRGPVIRIASMGDFELDGRLGVDVEANPERTAVVRRAEGLLAEIGVRLIQHGAFVANIRHSPAGPVPEL